LLTDLIMRVRTPYMLIVSLLVIAGCKEKHSAIREHINKPENGYIKNIETDEYSLSIQYQPPSYGADQEMMLNKSEAKKSELISEYDNLQQFTVKFTVKKGQDYPGDFGNMEKFNLLKEDTIPCIDAHQLQYNPGAPFQEMILLFPLTEKELGKEFTMIISDFPFNDTKHTINYSLN